MRCKRRLRSFLTGRAPAELEAAAKKIISNTGIQGDMAKLAYVDRVP
jgi:hypothetical protein